MRFFSLAACLAAMRASTSSADVAGVIVPDDGADGLPAVFRESSVIVIGPCVPRLASYIERMACPTHIIAKRHLHHGSKLTVLDLIRAVSLPQLVEE